MNSLLKLACLVWGLTVCVPWAARAGAPPEVKLAAEAGSGLPSVLKGRGLKVEGQQPPSSRLKSRQEQLVLLNQLPPIRQAWLGWCSTTGAKCLLRVPSTVCPERLADVMNAPIRSVMTYSVVDFFDLYGTGREPSWNPGLPWDPLVAHVVQQDDGFLALLVQGGGADQTLLDFAGESGDFGEFVSRFDAEGLGDDLFATQGCMLGRDR